MLTSADRASRRIDHCVALEPEPLYSLPSLAPMYPPTGKCLSHQSHSVKSGSDDQSRNMNKSQHNTKRNINNYTKVTS
jgi:hypothetical protein